MQKQLIPKCIQNHRDAGTLCVKSYRVKKKKKNLYFNLFGWKQIILFTT